MRQPIICIWRADGAMLSLFLFSLGHCVVFFISLQRPNSIRHNWNICIRPVLAGILLAAGRFVWAVGWRGAKGCRPRAVASVSSFKRLQWPVNGPQKERPIASNQVLSSNRHQLNCWFDWLYRHLASHSFDSWNAASKKWTESAPIATSCSVQSARTPQE